MPPQGASTGSTAAPPSWSAPRCPPRQCSSRPASRDGRDLGTNDGRFHAQPRRPTTTIGADASTAALQAAEQGRRRHERNRPFGYTADRIALDAEAELIREAVLGSPGRRVPAKHRRRLEHPSVHADRGPMAHPSAAPDAAVGQQRGLREHHGCHRLEAVWPGIIDRDAHERLRAILTDPGRQKFNGIDARRYLLSGFLVCGRCGKKLVARPAGDRRRRYVCASGPNFGGCGKTGRLAEPVEQLVAEWVVS